MSDRLKNIHEMVFIYNAVMDGWTVRKLRNGKIRLKKKTRNRSGTSKRKGRLRRTTKTITRSKRS